MSRLTDRIRRLPAEAWITAVLVGGSVLFIFLQLQPDLLFLDTTPAGGDMGAHVWGPAYLREELLPRFRLSGWAPDWYNGFPAYQFYMVLPSLAIVILDVVFLVPYNVAFKLVSVSGLLALPLAAWGMGRLARLPFPMPAALAVATVPFVFDRSFSIYGGNAASTLAGEFAFTISLAFALLFLGVVLRGLDTGRDRAWAAVLLGLTVLNHLIPAIFAVIGAVVALLLSFEWSRKITGLVLIYLAAVLAAFTVAGPVGVVFLHLLVGAALTLLLWRRPAVRAELVFVLGMNRLRAWWLVSVVGVGSLITCFWTIPFLLRRDYLTDMGWEKLTNYGEMLFPGRIGDLLPDGPGTVDGDLTLVILLAVVGAATSIWFQRRAGIWLAATAVVLAVGVVVAPQGRLWNARLLPFWYLSLYFLAALAVVELISAIAVLLSNDPQQPRRPALLAGPVVAALLTIVAVALPLRSLPFFGTTDEQGNYSWLGLDNPAAEQSYIKIWATWNYSGYERKDAYPEYQDVISAMRRVGEQRGCGRAMWEYDKDLDRFGTPMALMLLPYWTEGCIGSQEGLYFEASATTPYHFINQSELSAAPSRAQRDLPYGNLDVSLGVDHLQLMGVKYYMAFSDEAVAQADAEEDLTLVASTGAWRVYEVAHADLVQPLANQPAVVEDVPKGGKGWQDMAVEWYLDRSKWEVMLAVDGPEPWERVARGQTPVQTDVSSTTVSDVRTDTDRISFTVDRTGAPILVKTSYFPNWKAKNAEGPYRVAPNLMVVVPTDNLVSLEFERTSVDWLGFVLSIVGIGLVVVLVRRGRLRISPKPQRVRRPEPPAEGPWVTDAFATVGGGGDDRERWAPPPGGGTSDP